MQTSSPQKNYILTCHFTGIYDVNRNTILADDDYSLVKNWVDSIKAQNQCGIIFHNNFSEQTCVSNTNENIQFIHVETSTIYNPNVYRYFVYQNFLKQNWHQIQHIFITDSTDVVMLQNPFTQHLFVEYKQKLFCGDEPKILQNKWMIAHNEHLRNGINDFVAYEEKYKNETLLNCGIIGGNIKLMMVFLDKLCHIHEQYNQQNTTAYTGDMGAFNYLVRTQFNHILQHGEPVNTVFKGYEIQRNDCWFRHK